MKIIPKPYKLINKIQFYDWGTKNLKAFIPKLLGINVVKDLPYAELWIGAHPKASSEILIEGNKFPLNKIIEERPLEILGKYVADKFSNKLPFLLKVLSANNALSIQTHPNKEQAKKLHQSDPVNYPDDNHKPEIAIAIDTLTAIIGFRPVKEIQASINNIPELKEYFDKDLFIKIERSNNENELNSLIQGLYSHIMREASDKETMTSVIEKIVARLSSKQDLVSEEIQFLKQHKLFGADVGLLSFFFFNIVQLNPGQAIFTDAGIPHAYIEGNIIECMANSDNVVRAGLTNKFKDVNTLLDILHFNFVKCKIINEELVEDEVIYKTAAEEFEVSAFQKAEGFNKYYKSEDKPVIILILDGEVEASWNNKGQKNSERFFKGESFLIPANLTEFNLKCKKDSKYFIVRIPG
jgi:mannose-6-phosphate isomerase